jgi:hypothetical protein
MPQTARSSSPRRVDGGLRPGTLPDQTQAFYRAPRQLPGRDSHADDEEFMPQYDHTIDPPL